MYLLSKLAIHYGCNAQDESFFSLARKAFPHRPSFRFVVDILISIKAVGVGCGYLVVVGDMLPEVIMGSWQREIGTSTFRALLMVTVAVSERLREWLSE